MPAHALVHSAAVPRAVGGLGDAGEITQQFRADAIGMSTAAGSGHPTSSMSAASLTAVLAVRYLRYDWRRPGDPANDHLIFSKGHASPVLYALFKAAGVASNDELISSCRELGSPWQGHPTPALPWVDVATGSSGQGLPDAVGIALAGKYPDKLPYRVWVLCGDSETAEGSMREALDKAAHYRLAAPPETLTCVITSELTRQAPALGVVSWLDSLTAADVATTAITAAELLYGVARIPGGRRKTELAAAVHGLLSDDFQGRVLSFDEPAARRYADIVTGRERLGRPIGAADAQIAAICRTIDATLATRNTDDFEETGIELINPWKLG